MRGTEADAGAGDGTVTMLVCAAQSGALLTGWLVVQFGSTDPYGRPPGSALGLLCMLVFGPPLLLVLGVLHTFALTMPADLAAGAVARRAGGAHWRWQGATLTLIGAVYAIPLAVAGAPYTYSWAGISLSGVLPLLAVAWFRRLQERSGRPFTTGAVWFWSLAGGFLLTAVVAVACGVAVGTGLVGAYQAPHLPARQMAGVWESAQGRGEVRLETNGRAVLSGVPYETSDWSERRCDATGTWTYERGGGAAWSTVEFDVGDASCVLHVWTLGGSEERPELYALFGDPDAGDVRVLHKRG